MLTFILTVIFFRSAWKYRDRAYRYHLLDTGHLAENVLLALRAMEIPFRIDYDFDDERINHLLGIDDTMEAALALIHAPDTAAQTMDAEWNLEPLPHSCRKASRVSEKPIDYPAIREMHRAGASTKRVIGHAPEMTGEIGVEVDAWQRMEPPETWPEKRSYPDAVFYRRSGRNFTRMPLRRDRMEVLLASMCLRDPPGPDENRVYDGSVCPGFLAGSVEGWTPGFYLIDTGAGAYGLVKEGFFTEKMARICLDQQWLSHAAVHFLFLANLEALERTRGPRGYRYAMLNAGRMGERIYVSASSMGLGCCGIGALYDREAAECLGLNDSSRLLYLVAVGPVKKEI